MNYIHLIDGEKGGVGKSVVAQSIFYYCLKILRLAGIKSEPQPLTLEEVNNILQSESQIPNPSSDDETEVGKYPHIPLVLIDADRTNADVEKVYEKKFRSLITKGFFSENAKSEEEKIAAHAIFEAAIGKTVVVNVPSAAKRAIDSWFSVNDLFELAELQEEPIKFVKWFVSNGLKDSLELYKDSVNKYSRENPGKMTHILVKNNFFCDDWKLLDNQDYSEVITKDFTMEFPALDEMYSIHIRDEKLDYDDAISGQGFFRNKVIARHAVFKFTKKVSEGFAKYIDTPQTKVPWILQRSCKSG
uniref:hypothetical protein n=1 Tax=Okeania sp. SIO2F4 TaxID=2607790 RepID=UPI0025FDC90A|nr:hypothetical protein [Okeania sp. SIO2F4]